MFAEVVVTGEIHALPLLLTFVIVSLIAVGVIVAVVILRSRGRPGDQDHGNG